MCDSTQAGWWSQQSASSCGALLLEFVLLLFGCRLRVIAGVILRKSQDKKNVMKSEEIKVNLRNQNKSKRTHKKS